MITCTRSTRHRIAPVFALAFLVLAPLGYFGNDDTLLTLALVAGALCAVCALFGVYVEYEEDVPPEEG